MKRVIEINFNSVRSKLKTLRTLPSIKNMSTSNMINFGKAAVYTIFFVIYAVYAFLEVLVCKIIPNSKKSLIGEVFLITGSASGIGREVALHLAKHHHKTTLVLWDCNDHDQETVDLLKSFGSKVFSYKVDVTNQTEVAETAKRVAKEAGDVTILFNNAGILGTEVFFSQSPEKVEKMIQVNLLSHFWTLKAFMPSMIRNNHGHVVTTSSGAGWVGLRNEVPYSATKFAIRGYIESLQSELRHHPLKPNNIKFTTVFLAMVQTPMTVRLRVKTRFPYFTKVLEPQYVAENIIDAVCKNQETLFLPKSLELIARLKSLTPRKLTELWEDFMIQNISFVDESPDAEDKQ